MNPLAIEVSPLAIEVTCTDDRLTIAYLLS
jgi:hypothetical protein